MLNAKVVADNSKSQNDIRTIIKNDDNKTINVFVYCDKRTRGARGNLSDVWASVTTECASYARDGEEDHKNVPNPPDTMKRAETIYLINNKMSTMNFV